MSTSQVVGGAGLQREWTEMRGEWGLCCDCGAVTDQQEKRNH